VPQPSSACSTPRSMRWLKCVLCAMFIVTMCGVTLARVKSL
jgi:hypothetical protein